MSAMVLCSACKRHIFARETACPFCGYGIRSDAKKAQEARALAPELSRGERYAIGAAIAVSMTTSACSSPTTIHHPDDLNRVDVVDVNAGPNGNTNTQNTQTTQGSGNVLEVATDPDPNANTVAADDARERQRLEEQRRREEEERRRQEQLQLQREEHWRHRPPCHGNVCPPYGCVFPDEACDIVRA